MWYSVYDFKTVYRAESSGDHCEKTRQRLKSWEKNPSTLVDRFDGSKKLGIARCEGVGVKSSRGGHLQSTLKYRVVAPLLLIVSSGNDFKNSLTGRSNILVYISALLFEQTTC